MTTPHIRDFRDQRVHMIGIGGSSMSGLAQMLLDQGYHITGSDNTHSHAVERLEAEGVQVFIGHDARNVEGAALIIYSAAIAPDNPERAYAFAHDIPQMERAVLLGQVMEGHQDAVCISGAHGKTTASSMLAQLLLDCGMDPAVHIGGRLDALGGAGFFDRKTFSFAANCLKGSLPVNNANLHFGNLAKGKPSGFNGCSPKHVSSA